MSMSSADDAPEIVLTADGSHSVRSHRFAVDYHSIHGAVQESRHVFLQAGLELLMLEGPAEVRILEMGFGTGLNALLVRDFARRHPAIPFTYHTLERFPLTEDAVGRLNYPEQLDLPASDLLELHERSWETLHALGDNFTFCKSRNDWLQRPPADWTVRPMDLIFYDAFAPASQPELWTPAAMAIAFDLLRPGGTLVTYCAKGQFKRDLRAVGFTVEALPGPPGKREMTRAIRPA